MTGILIAGTSSDAGKSLVVTGICRALARRGLAVAPFKAQNMSNNSMVCADGSEIGRAQHLQALAARVEPSALMNPVLLKPGTDRRSFVVVRGRPAGALEAGEYATGRAHLREAAFAAYEELAVAHDIVVCEGAGSPAEINLRAGDYVNLGLARRFDLPVVLVGDIDRGGILASIFGTWAILEPDDRATLAAYIINKFRGDLSVLEPGLTELTARTGLPCLGVLPWLPGVWLDGEDALDLGRWRAERGSVAAVSGVAAGTLTVAVVQFPRISNATDIDALAQEEGLDVVMTCDPRLVAEADLVVLPGTRSTLEDLAWLRRQGLATAIAARAAAGRPVLGICGGYQMLARSISDEDGVESPGRERVDGLGLLPIDVTFHATKVLGRPRGSWAGHPVIGYEIHHGVCRRIADDRFGAAGTPAVKAAAAEAAAGEVASGAEVAGGAEPFLDGWRAGAVWGTLWHGAFENDDFRRAWLATVARSVDRAWTPGAADGYAARREAMIERLADAVEQHLDLPALLELTRARPA